MKNLQQPYLLRMPDAEVWYYPGIFDPESCETFFHRLKGEINWKADRVRVFGKWYDQPRLTALYAMNDHPYAYSGLTLYPEQYIPVLWDIHKKIEESSGCQFSSCLLNLYRDGNDSNGWHADDEKELGTNPVIASVSFGQERIFHFRHKSDKSLKEKILLENGSLLLMKGATQHFWQHQLPKSRKAMNPRINLTFRNIMPPARPTV